MFYGSGVHHINCEQPRHCKSLHCKWSLESHDDETIIDEYGKLGNVIHYFECQHPNCKAQGEEPLECDCPILLAKLTTEGFLEKCHECPEIEYDYWSGGIDVWCNQDRLFECVLEELNVCKNKTQH